MLCSLRALLRPALAAAPALLAGCPGSPATNAAADGATARPAAPTDTTIAPSPADGMKNG